MKKVQTKRHRDSSASSSGSDHAVKRCRRATRASTRPRYSTSSSDTNSPVKGYTQTIQKMRSVMCRGEKLSSSPRGKVLSSLSKDKRQYPSSSDNRGFSVLPDRDSPIKDKEKARDTRRSFTSKHKKRLSSSRGRSCSLSSSNRDSPVKCNKKVRDKRDSSLSSDTESPNEGQTKTRGKRRFSYKKYPTSSTCRSLSSSSINRGSQRTNNKRARVKRYSSSSTNNESPIKRNENARDGQPRLFSITTNDQRRDYVNIKGPGRSPFGMNIDSPIKGYKKAENKINPSSSIDKNMRRSSSSLSRDNPTIDNNQTGVVRLSTSFSNRNSSTKGYEEHISKSYSYSSLNRDSPVTDYKRSEHRKRSTSRDRRRSFSSEDMDRSSLSKDRCSSSSRDETGSSTSKNKKRSSPSNKDSSIKSDRQTRDKRHSSVSKYGRRSASSGDKRRPPSFKNERYSSSPKDTIRFSSLSDTESPIKSNDQSIEGRLSSTCKDKRRSSPRDKRRSSSSKDTRRLSSLSDRDSPVKSNEQSRERRRLSTFRDKRRFSSSRENRRSSSSIDDIRSSSPRNERLSSSLPDRDSPFKGNKKRNITFSSSSVKSSPVSDYMSIQVTLKRRRFSSPTSPYCATSPDNDYNKVWHLLKRRRVTKGESYCEIYSTTKSDRLVNSKIGSVAKVPVISLLKNKVGDRQATVPKNNMEADQNSEDKHGFPQDIDLRHNCSGAIDSKCEELSLDGEHFESEVCKLSPVANGRKKGAGSTSDCSFLSPSFQPRGKNFSYSEASPRSALKGLDQPHPWACDFIARSETYNSAFIDSHCHIDLLYDRLGISHNTRFCEFRKMVACSFPVNFEGCVAVFCYPKTYDADDPHDQLLQTLAEDDNIWFSIGCHPKSATEFTTRHEQGLRKALSHPKVVALGEIGLDYSGTFYHHAETQKAVMRKQVKMALDLKLPLVIHCRDAYDDCLAILLEMVPRSWRIHLHCFCGNMEVATLWLDYFSNLYIGLTPVITYRSAHGSISSAQNIPLDRLLLETDSPYFVPGNIKKSKISVTHPGFALFTAERIAELKNVPVGTVLEICRKNTWEMYGI